MEDRQGDREDDDNPANKIARFKQQISSFQQVARISKDDAPDECKFVADPFIQYDPAAGLWVLFAEVAFPARRQYIGMFTSRDLHRWDYHGDAVKGSRESFPFISPCKGYYLMVPCIDAAPAPGLVAIYRAETLLGPWLLAYHFVLDQKVNDRVIAPRSKHNSYYFVYGVSRKVLPALKYAKIEFNAAQGPVFVENSRVLLRKNIIEYIKGKFFKYPRTTLRPAGGLVKYRDGFIMPLQGTYTGRYGECIALSYIRMTEEELDFAAMDFIRPNEFSPDWTACHHISFFTGEDSASPEVYAVDGHSDGTDWEVRIFVK